MNWPLDGIAGKDVVFVGAGLGRSLAGVQSFLESHGKINSFTALDRGDRSWDELLRDYDQNHTLFIKNEAVPGRELHVPYTSTVQLFFELVRATGAATVGITGTKGKSTTTALTAHILQSAGKDAVLAGNIGVSPFNSLAEATGETIYVLELSSYQLSDLRMSPHVSACLNLYNDHTTWHGSLEAYWEAKHNIMRYATPDDVFIYNPEFPELVSWAKAATCRTIPIDPTERLSLDHAHLFGEHNRLNALVARTIVRQFAVPDEITQQAIDDFSPLRHRMQIVAEKRGVTYVDDGIGMTPESTMASMRAIQQKFHHIGCMLMGGLDRHYDFSAVMRLVADLRIPNLVLFPDTVEKMRAALPPGYHPTILETRSMDDAVAFAAEHAPQGSVVLLSTAAPSYSLWRDFEDKGDRFQEAVTRL